MVSADPLGTRKGSSMGDGRALRAWLRERPFAAVYGAARNRPVLRLARNGDGLPGQRAYGNDDESRGCNPLVRVWAGVRPSRRRPRSPSLAFAVCGLGLLVSVEVAQRLPALAAVRPVAAAITFAGTEGVEIDPTHGDLIGCFCLRAWSRIRRRVDLSISA